MKNYCCIICWFFAKFRFVSLPFEKIIFAKKCETLAIPLFFCQEKGYILVISFINLARLASTFHASLIRGRIYRIWASVKKWLAPLKKCIQCFMIYAGAKLKPVFGGFETRLKFIKFGRRQKLDIVVNRTHH